MKPGIMILSTPHSESFDWMSDGWNIVKLSETPEAKTLKAKADKAISDAIDYFDAIRRLEVAGFKITESER